MKLNYRLFGLGLLAVSTGAIGPSAMASDTHVNTEALQQNQKTDQYQQGPLGSVRSTDEVKVSRRIQHALMSNDDLSENAKHSKVVVVGHTITLKGPVNSEHEKEKVVAIAKQSAPSYDQVSDELDIVQ